MKLPKPLLCAVVLAAFFTQASHAQTRSGEGRDFRVKAISLVKASTQKALATWDLKAKKLTYIDEAGKTYTMKLDPKNKAFVLPDVVTKQVALKQNFNIYTTIEGKNKRGKDALKVPGKIGLKYALGALSTSAPLAYIESLQFFDPRSLCGDDEKGRALGCPGIIVDGSVQYSFQLRICSQLINPDSAALEFTCPKHEILFQGQTVFGYNPANPR